MIPVLVDYDNVDFPIRKSGLLLLARRILTHVEGITPTKRDVNIRLYGGWYEQNRLTRLAQRLSAEITNSFPCALLTTQGTSIVGMHLARSLISVPGHDMLHTFRMRGAPPNLQCDDPLRGHCSEPHCPLTAMHTFVTRGVCPESTCQIRPQDLLHRGEQKLVDTMLTADLIHFSLNATSPLHIVTSDDDLFPGIIMTLAQGASVIHIHTKGRVTNPIYASVVAGKPYTQKSL